MEKWSLTGGSEWRDLVMIMNDDDIGEIRA